MLGILLLASYTVSIVFGGSCGGSTWKVAYSGSNCDLNNGQYKIKCQSKGNPGTCGMRLDGTPRLGQGTYSASIKAAPGNGMNTALYLFTYGRNNDKSRPWNEIDIEILGKQIYGGKTRVWTNLWTGHGTQHYQFVTLNFDASKGFHTYAIKIDSNKIYWIFDGSTKRTLTYTGFGDVVSTVNNKNFQAELVLWGLNDGSWPEMGGMWENNNNFPLYAYFKNVKLNQCTSCGSSSGGGGSSGGSSGKIKITNKNGLNKWWYAVVLSNIPNGVNIQWIKMRAKGQSSWETGVKEYDYYKFTKYKPYSAPFDFKIRTTNGQTVTSYDIIKNLNAGTSAYMTKSVSSGFTIDDNTSTELSWTIVFAIIILSVCFCAALIGGLWYFKKRRGNKRKLSAVKIDDDKELNSIDTPVDGDNNPTKTGYDMSPIGSVETNEDTPMGPNDGDNDDEEIEVEIEMETATNE